MLTVFATTLAFAECSKTELLQFIELGFSKEEIKQICKDDSISFDEEQSVDSEQKSDEKRVSDASDLDDEEEGFFEKYVGLELFGDDDEEDVAEEEVVQQESQIDETPTTSKNHQIVLEFGSLEGEFTMRSEDEILGAYSEKLDHDLRGSSFMISYQHNFRGLVVGAGYQSLGLNGESEKVQRTFTTSTGLNYDMSIQLRVENLSIIGLFALIGYEFTVFNNIEITPQARWGFANNTTIELTGIVSANDPTNTVLSGSTINEKYESQTDVKVFALPVIWRFDSFGAGLNVYTVRNEFIDEFETTTAKYQTKNGLLLSFGNKF